MHVQMWLVNFSDVSNASCVFYCVSYIFCILLPPGFGSTTNPAGGSGGLFGASASTGGGGLFGATGSTGAFGGGAVAAAGGTTVAFAAPSGQDTMMKNGVTTNINTKHQCITAMKEYESKSIEVSQC